MDAPSATPDRLYSPGQITLAALIGAPWAAGWFISRNEQRLGRSRAGARWLWGSVAGTIVLLIVSSLLPPTFPRQGLAVGYIAGFFVAAKQLYGSTVEAHVATGGRLGSWWSVAAISLLWLIATVTLLVAVVSLLPPHYVQRTVLELRD